MAEALDPIEIAKRVKARREAEKDDPGPRPTRSKLLDPLDVEMMVVPDIVGTVPGWRAWQIDQSLPEYGGKVILRSATHDAFWPPRELLEATCSKHPDDPTHVPDSKCSCGLYAAKTLKHLLSMGYPKYGEHRGGRTFRVIGEVKLWGRVIEGSQGWRAQNGYPAKLYVPYEATHLAVPLMKTYGVPVELKNWLK